jgi:hypothetical protein
VAIGSDLGSAADIAQVVGAAVGEMALLVATGVAIVAWKEWRHKTGHRLYIPAPGDHQDPVSPIFWVYPPSQTADGKWAVQFAGKIVNAGPADAFRTRTRRARTDR